MTDQSSMTTLADYLRTLRTYWRFILGFAVVAAAAAFGISNLQENKYEAQAALRVTEPSQELNILGGAGAPAANPLATASTHAPQVTRTQVIEAVKRQLGTDLSPDEIRDMVSTEVDPNSFVVLLKVESSDPEQAAGIANTVADVDAHLTTEQVRRSFARDAENLANQIQNLNTSDDPITRTIYTDRLSRLESLATIATPVELSERATVPGSPSSPKPVRNTIAAAIIGLLVGIALALGRRLLDRRLRDPREVEDLFDQPIVGRIRNDALGHTGSVHDLAVDKLGALDAIDAEAFRRLRENVRYLSVDKDLRTLAITSAVAQEGKSTVAACLAMASAAANYSTLLIECDLRRPVLAERFGIPATPGLSDYLRGAAEPRDILQRIPTPTTGVENGEGPSSLICITAGTEVPRPAEVLSSQRFHDLVAKVSTVYELVVIDCPPLLPVADTLEIIPHASAVLMCLRLGRTTREQAQLAHQAVEQLPSRPTGIVITDDPRRDKDYYTGYYEYQGDERSFYAPASEPSPTGPVSAVRTPDSARTVAPATHDIASSRPGIT
jgi:capsular exopolysaccharide synthesis family protein